jgi:hypothetical protein
MKHSVNAVVEQCDQEPHVTLHPTPEAAEEYAIALAKANTGSTEEEIRANLKATSSHFEGSYGVYLANAQVIDPTQKAGATEGVTAREKGSLRRYPAIPTLYGSKEEAEQAISKIILEHSTDELHAWLGPDWRTLKVQKFEGNLPAENTGEIEGTPGQGKTNRREVLLHPDEVEWARNYIMEEGGKDGDNGPEVPMIISVDFGGGWEADIKIVKAAREDGGPYIDPVLFLNGNEVMCIGVGETLEGKYIFITEEGSFEAVLIPVNRA